MRLGGGLVVLLLLACVPPWCAGWWWGGKHRGYRPEGRRGFRGGDRRFGYRRHGFGRRPWEKRVCFHDQVPIPTFPENVDQDTAVVRSYKAILRFPVDLPNATTSIDLNYNLINGLANQTLAKLQDLQILLLRQNMIAHIEPDTFRHVPKLTTLVLGGNRLSDFPWRHMQAQSLLTYLGLAGNRLTSLPTETFRFLPALKELRIENNKLTSIPEGIFNDRPLLETVYMRENLWQCDCEFLLSYKTFPSKITRLHPCMTCTFPQGYRDMLVSSVSVTPGCTEGSGEAEETKNHTEGSGEIEETTNDNVSQKNPENSDTVNLLGETAFPRKFCPLWRPRCRRFHQDIHRASSQENDEQTKMTKTDTKKLASPLLSNKPLPPLHGNQGQSAKRLENDGNGNPGQTVKTITRPIPNTRRLTADRDEVFKGRPGQGHLIQRFWGTPKPSDQPMGSQKTATSANHRTDSPSTRPMRRLDVMLPRAGAFHTINPKTIAIIAVLVALVGVSPLCVALLKTLRTKKQDKTQTQAPNEVDDGDIHPYSTTYLSKIAISESPSTKPPQLASGYSNPADLTIVRQTYAEPYSTQTNPKGQINTSNGDPKTSLNIRGPEAEDIYEDAVPVVFKIGRFPAEEMGGELLDKVNNEPFRLEQATNSLQAQAAQTRQSSDQLDQPFYHTIAACPPGEAASPSAFREETDEYEEVWNCIGTAQREKGGNQEAIGVGMKEGPQAEMEANMDYYQQLIKPAPHIYEKPEVVIAKLKLKT
ncbi:uncharacterized protein LOC144865072 [Branchiostoma floridae x Branchiostoma japonicum]